MQQLHSTMGLPDRDVRMRRPIPELSFVGSCAGAARRRDSMACCSNISSLRSGLSRSKPWSQPVHGLNLQLLQRTRRQEHVTQSSLPSGSSRKHSLQIMTAPPSTPVELGPPGWCSSPPASSSDEPSSSHRATPAPGGGPAAVVSTSRPPPRSVSRFHPGAYST
jgi:hypothetical protein